MPIIRRSSLKAAPWKNGGGVTHEVIRQPAEGRFLWRVSVADIGRPGPFSDFAGYARIMVLLRGAGVRLTSAGRAPVELSAVGQLVEFDGALATCCELLDGPCTDLNLMVAKDSLSVRASVLRLAAPRSLEPGLTSLVFVIEGVVDAALGAGGSGSGAAVERLEPWDVAWVASGAGNWVGPCTQAGARADSGSGAAPDPLVFVATLGEPPARTYS